MEQEREGTEEREREKEQKRERELRGGRNNKTTKRF